MAYAPTSLAAIADPTRQTMLARLSRRPMTVGELAEELPVTRPAVSQHLKILKQARIVTETREGTRHIFNLNPEGLLELRGYINTLCEGALGPGPRSIAAQRRKRRKLKK